MKARVWSSMCFQQGEGSLSPGTVKFREVPLTALCSLPMYISPRGWCSSPHVWLYSGHIKFFWENQYSDHNIIVQTFLNVIWSLLTNNILSSTLYGHMISKQNWQHIESRKVSKAVKMCKWSSVLQAFVRCLVAAYVTGNPVCFCCLQIIFKASLKSV